MEFMVNVTKVDGTMIGLRLSADGSNLRITRVSNDGLIANWNEANPSKQVRRDDRVVEVNGTRGDARTMLRVCTSCPNLELVVRPTAEIEQRLRTMQYCNLSRDDFEFLCWLDEAIPTKTGMHRRFVAQLPRTMAPSRGAVDTCAICLTDCDDEGGVTQLPCRHRFCTKCIMQWLTDCRVQCPLCNTSVQCPEEAQLSSFDDSVGCDVVVELDDPQCSTLVHGHIFMPTLMSARRLEGLRIRAATHEVSA